MLFHDNAIRYFLNSFKSMPWRQCFLLFFLSSCKFFQNQDSTPPEMIFTNNWSTSPAPGMQECSIDNFIWWQSLNDPQLDILIERAKTQNIDLFIAAMRILQAREEIKGGASGAFPHLDFSAGYDYLQFNQKTLDRILDIHQHEHKTRHINLFELGFDAEWEIDLFGASANKIKALKYQALATEEEFRQIELTLAAEVARNYIELRGWQTKLQHLEKQLEVQKELVSLAAGLAQAGFISSIDEVKIQEQVYLLQARKPEIVFLTRKSIHRLSVLLGYPPEILYAELCQPEQLPQLPYQKPIGVPSELLRQRPDIRKAEKNLASSLALVDSAVAELFPRISLKGFIGDLAAQRSNSLVLFGGPQLLFPLFNSKLLTQGNSNQ